MPTKTLRKHLSIPGWWARGGLQCSQGQIRLQDCTLLGREGTDLSSGSIWHGGSALLIDGCSDVVLTDCHVVGGGGGDIDQSCSGCLCGNGGEALAVIGSSATLYGCTIVGGAAGQSPTQGGVAGNAPPACHLDHSELFAADSRFLGGAGGDGSHTTLSCSAGGAGLRMIVSTADELGCSFHGGTGGHSTITGTSCDAGPDVDGQVDSIQGPARQLQVPAVTREGTPLVIQSQGRAGDRVFLFQSTETRARYLPFARGVDLLGPRQGSTSLVPDWTLGVGGVLTLSRRSPRLPLSTESALLHLQALHLSTSRGPILSNLQTLLVLDASL